MTAKAHVDAVKALIGSAVRLYEGQVPEAAVLPYAVLYVDNGSALRTTLATVSDRRDVEFQVTSVGVDGDGARSVAERVRTAVLDRRPSVTGRATGPIAQVDAELLRVDRDVTPHRMYVVDRYSFSSVPTS